MRFQTALLLGFLLLALGVSAQTGSMERIVAVVGKEIILKSDIDGQVAIMVQRNPAAAKDNEQKLHDYVLDQLINERLIMTKAIEDSVEVSEEQITERMEFQIKSLVQQFGSEKRIEDVYGMSMSRIRREFRDEIRKQLLVETMRDKKFANTKITRGEVDDFYKRYHDSIPKVQPRVDLYHIVKFVKASATQKKEANELALRIRDSIMKGGSFSDFARRHSGDPGSAVNGGDLGTVERGKFVPAFENAAFGLQPEEISQPVETPFGFHIIQLITKSGNSITARHILIRVGQSETDKEVARAALLDVKKKVGEGTSFVELAKTASDERETAGFGGAMGQIELERLPEDMKAIVANLPDGGVSEPLPYTTDPTRQGYHILYRKEILAEHSATMDGDYKLLEQMATYEKRQRLEQEWITELRRTLYWEKR
ncbi:MAG: peptidylprolyl isomerase [bacterium]|nr:peptidylprolyl isomerase [bacterium]